MGKRSVITNVYFLMSLTGGAVFLAADSQAIPSKIQRQKQSVKVSDTILNKKTQLEGRSPSTKPCNFICVQPRAPKPFVVRGQMMASQNTLRSLSIQQMSSRNPQNSYAVYEHNENSVDLDKRFQAVASQWSDALPFRMLELEGDIQEAILYVPEEMGYESAPALLRTRMKLRMKDGALVDLRMSCARTT